MSKSMKILILGSSGLLGNYLDSYFFSQRHEVQCIGRKSLQYDIDINDDIHIKQVIDQFMPNVVINCVALVDLPLCEKNPELAYCVNTQPLLYLSEYCAINKIKLVQISSDQFYSGQCNILHSENEPISLLPNFYSRTKYLAERIVLSYDIHCVVRTNITGFKKNKSGKTSFVEWCIQSILSSSKPSLFYDYYCSTIDCKTFSFALNNILMANFTGIINIASSDSISKRDFYCCLSKELGIDNPSFQEISISSIFPTRPFACGLDVSLYNAICPIPLPSSNQVVKNLVNEYHDNL